MLGTIALLAAYAVCLLTAANHNGGMAVSILAFSYAVLVVWAHASQHPQAGAPRASWHGQQRMTAGTGGLGFVNLIATEINLLHAWSRTSGLPPDHDGTSGSGPHW